MATTRSHSPIGSEAAGPLTVVASSEKAVAAVAVGAAVQRHRSLASGISAWTCRRGVEGFRQGRRPWHAGGTIDRRYVRTSEPPASSSSWAVLVDQVAAGTGQHLTGA